jgi:hypothetical protein
MAHNRNCCRLCLAPQNECVEIFKTQAADKQPIQSKISSCVQIQVSVISFILNSRKSLVIFTQDPVRRKMCISESSNI